MSKAVRSLANPRHTPSGCPRASGVRPQPYARKRFGAFPTIPLTEWARLSSACSTRSALVSPMTAGPGLATACRGALTAAARGALIEHGKAEILPPPLLTRRNSRKAARYVAA